VGKIDAFDKIATEKQKKNRKSGNQRNFFT